MRRRAERAVRPRHRPVIVERLGIADVVGETELHRLGAVSHRAAADRRDQIGANLARHRGGFDDGMARRVRRHVVEHAGAAVAERSPHLGDLVGLTVQRAADHQEDALGLNAARLFGDRLRGRLAEGHRLHLAEGNPPCLRHGPSSRLSCSIIAPRARRRLS